jgi:hypothetical protein
MQLSVPKYRAIGVGRGANLDLIDAPLNNRLWLKRRFMEVRALPDEAARRTALGEIADWTNPGPGGFYDDLGNPSRQPHLVRGPGYPTDPAFWQSALTGFSSTLQERLSWSDHAESLHENPLRMRYAGLDPGARYRVRITYGGENTRGKVRLEAGDGMEVHPFIDKPAGGKQVTFDLPPGAVRNGELTLTWRREPGLGGNGRGCQVAEVWLIRVAEP